MSFSIYTSLYNLSGGFIDYNAALDNFCSFAEEVVVGTTTDSKGNTIELLQEYQKSNSKVKLAITDFKLDTAEFDGQIKNAALKLCTKKFCILLDGDERLVISDKNKWIELANKLESSSFEAVMIPVIDLFNSEKEYKSIGRKWYLHRNNPTFTRGIVNFAKKQDGNLDHSKSDTCELLNEDGNLVKAALIEQTLTVEEIKDKDVPYILHYGYLDKENRLKSNKFWQPIWNKRAGEEVTDIIHSIEELNKIKYFKHNLKLPNE